MTDNYNEACFNYKLYFCVLLEYGINDYIVSVKFTILKLNHHPLVFFVNKKCVFTYAIAKNWPARICMKEVAEGN